MLKCLYNQVLIKLTSATIIQQFDITDHVAKHINAVHDECFKQLPNFQLNETSVRLN